MSTFDVVFFFHISTRTNQERLRRWSKARVLTYRVLGGHACGRLSNPDKSQTQLQPIVHASSHEIILVAIASDVFPLPHLQYARQDSCSSVYIGCIQAQGMHAFTYSRLDSTRPTVLQENLKKLRRQSVDKGVRGLDKKTA